MPNHFARAGKYSNPCAWSIFTYLLKKKFWFEFNAFKSNVYK